MANKSPDSSRIEGTRRLVIDLPRLSPASPDHRSGTASEQEDSDQEIRRLSQVLGDNVDENRNKGGGYTQEDRTTEPDISTEAEANVVWSKLF
jgi:hypothetical protein